MLIKMVIMILFLTGAIISLALGYSALIKKEYDQAIGLSLVSLGCDSLALVAILI